MSASHAPVLDAVAFQLAAALERYELDLAVLMDTWLDMDRYREVSEQVEQIRMYAAALPQLSVAWVEVLISHAELIHHMWRRQNARPAPAPEEVRELRKRHAAAIERMRAGCLRLLARPPAGGDLSPLSWDRAPAG
jgi:hypothetical protein